MSWEILLIVFVVIVFAALIFAWSQGLIDPSIFTGGARMIKLTTQAIWIPDIVSGKKTVEGRVGGKDKFKDLVGHDALIVAEPKHKVRVTVNGTKHYETLEKFVQGEGHKKIVPQSKSDKDAIDVLLALKNKKGESIFSPAVIKERGGIVALEIKAHPPLEKTAPK